MKGFAIVLLCALVAVQGRGIEKAVALTNAKADANPGLVHLRIAVSTSGLLNTCLGTLIHGNWVLTTDSCVTNARFVWVRLNAPRVWNPELVIEVSVTDANQNARRNGVVGLLRTRYIDSSDNITPYGLSTSVPSSANFCSYGEQSGQPGENLSCSSIDLNASGDNYSSNADVSRFDVGAPLVVDGQVSAILSNANGNFVPVAGQVSWINQQTGLSLGQ